MTLLAGALLTLAVTIAIHAFYQFALLDFTVGLFSFEAFLNGITTAAALFLGTITGIISSLILINFSKGHDAMISRLNRRTILIACAISPVIIGGFYDKVSSIDSFWVIFILSHQNGYFWENVSTLISKTPS